MNHETVILEPVDVSNQLCVCNLDEFLKLNLPPRELILSPLLPRAGLCMVHAYRGVGKTHVSLGIAFAVATGGEFLGWKASKPRGVLYIDGEMPAAVLQERLSNIMAMNGVEVAPSNLCIITPDLQKDGLIPHLDTIEGQQIIEQYITDDIDLIVIDNLSCLAPSINEGESSDWVVMQTWVLRLRALGKSVLLVHHSGKSGLQRGTSRREDVLDTVFTLERPKDYDASQGAKFIIKFEKSRGFWGDDAKAFEAQLIEVNGLLTWKVCSVEQSSFEKVVTMLNDGFNQTEIAIELDLHKSTISRHAASAREQGLIKGRNNDA